MALAVTLVDSYRAGNRVEAIVAIVASGNYVSGGDTLDLAAVLAGLGVGDAPVFGQIEGQAGCKYEWVPGTTPSNGKMKCRVEAAVATNTLLGEHTAVAYVAGITGDTIRGRFVFKRG